jgi:hypothetical protein
MTSFRITPRPAPTAPSLSVAAAPLLRWLIGWARVQRRRVYWRVLLGGVIALIVLWAVMKQSKVEALVPVFAVLFGLLGPLTFLAYWYDRRMPRDLPGRHLLIAAAIGAGLGVVAPLLLYGVFSVRSDQPLGALLVAAVDTLSIGLCAVYALRAGGPVRQRDGVLVGVAAGLGYTAARAITYGLIVFHQTVTVPTVKTPKTTGHAHVVVPPVVHAPHVDLFLPGIANFYHVMAIEAQTQVFAGVIWAAILCAAIWRERGARPFVFTGGLALTIALVLALRTLWLLSFAHHWLFVWIQIPFDPYTPYLALVNLVILAPLGILLLRFFLREARDHDAAGPALPRAGLAESLVGYLREKRDNTRSYFAALARVQSASVPVGGRNWP